MSLLKTTIEILQNACMNPLFIDRHRNSPTFFLRRRKLSFSVIVGTLVNLVKQSLQIVCNHLGDLFEMTEPVSKQAFSKARHKISHTAFIELNDMALEAYYRQDKAGLWKDIRLFACDGSTLRLPDSEEIEAHFDRWDRGGNNRSENCPVIGRLSEFTDMTSGLIVSGRLAPWKNGEQTLAKEQLVEVVQKMKDWGQQKLLFVYDRGYPSREYFQQHIDLGVDFLFRLPRRFNKRVDTFVDAGNRDIINTLYEALPPLRIIVIPLQSGELEVLLTSLTDCEKYPYEDFAELYSMRWGAMEEGYKRQKVCLELTNWASQSVLGVMQEFWSTILVNNIVCIGCVEIEGPVLPKDKPVLRINRSILFGSLRYDVLAVMTGEISSEEFEKKFKRVAERGKIPYRPDRHYSREGLGKPKRYFVYPRTC